MYSFTAAVNTNTEFHIGTIKSLCPSVPTTAVVLCTITTNISGNATIVCYSVGHSANDIVYARSSTGIPVGVNLTFTVYYI